MKREFGAGDIVTVVGIMLYFGFMLAMWIVRMSVYGFDFPLSLNQLILVLMTGIPVTALILSFTRPDLLNVQYGFAGLIVLLKLTGVQGLEYRGYEFYVVLGALLIGFGAHIARGGPSILGIKTEDNEKKKK